jgi:hypothetical protein
MRDAASPSLAVQLCLVELVVVIASAGGGAHLVYTAFHSRRMKRNEPCTPVRPLNGRSGGAVNIMNMRAVSAP